MDFEVLILGSDANAYYMARCCYEAYKKRAYLIAKEKLGFTKYSNILNISYEQKLWNEKVFLDTLDKFKIEHNGKIILISTNETYTEFITKNKEKIHKDYIFNLPSINVIKSLTNKELFYKKYKNSNLDFPKTYYYSCIRNASLPVNLVYPLIVKPANVVAYNHLRFSGKNKIYKIYSEDELLNVIDKIQNSGYKDKLIIQEFIPGDDSCLFDSVLYINGHGDMEFISFAQIGLQERTTTMVGNAAVLINGVNTTNGDEKKQVLKIKEFMESINYRGFAEVDMKYDIRDNTFKVLEINARQGRSSYYVTCLGKNLVKAIVEDCLYGVRHNFEFLDKKVLLSFVPKGIIKKYVLNNDLKEEILKMYGNVIKPMDAPDDKNIKRWLLLRKRWLHYYFEYKNSYWK